MLEKACRSGNRPKYAGKDLNMRKKDLKMREKIKEAEKRPRDADRPT